MPGVAPAHTAWKSSVWNSGWATCISVPTLGARELRSKWPQGYSNKHGGSVMGRGRTRLGGGALAAGALVAMATMIITRRVE